MNAPLLLDLFCGAGGCSVGYAHAGFSPVGVDITPQPRYPFPFVQGDALEIMARLLDDGGIEARDGRIYRLADFAMIHASPPCQFASELTPTAYRENHPNHIPAVRDLLKRARLPFVIENVRGARHHLVCPHMLCGSMFGLGVWRHRYFEIWPPRLIMTSPCNHSRAPVLISGTRRRDGERHEHTAQQCRNASGLHWMTRAEMDEAIPPAFTEFVGCQMMAALFFGGD